MRRPDLRTNGFLGVAISAAAVAVLAGCGSTSAAAGPNPTPIAASVAASPTPDVAAAGAAALTIFYALPGQNPEVWVPCSSQGADFAKCPFAASVKTRLTDLGSSG